jgi:hypothetical protein
VTEELRDVEEQEPRQIGPVEVDAPELAPGAAQETDDPLFDKAVGGIEDAQVVTGEEGSPVPATPNPGSPGPLSPTPPETAEEAVKPTVPPPPTTSKGPTVPPGPKPKRAQRTKLSRKEMVTMLACADHPMPLEVVKDWTPEMLHHAQAWAQEEIIAMDAAEAGVDYEKRYLPRPSFIPAYGNPHERARLGFPDTGLPDSQAEEARQEAEPEQGTLIHPFPDNPCMFAFDDGGACGLEAGHEGDHEPL